jgi:hypothetical protein
MDSASENISNVVALLTAIKSGQEDVAYQLVLELNPIELFSALAGILLSAFNSISEMTGKSVEFYLQELGRLASDIRTTTNE